MNFHMFWKCHESHLTVLYVYLINGSIDNGQQNYLTNTGISLRTKIPH